MKKLLRDSLSVPYWIYLVVFIVCVVLIVPALIWESCSASSIAANIGYSLLASNVAGILFDLGTNYSNKNKAEKQYAAITDQHRDLLNDLIIVTDYTCENLGIKGYAAKTFTDQLRTVFYDNPFVDELDSKAYLNATEDMRHWLELVKSESDKWMNISYIMYENENFNEKKRFFLRLISGLAAEALLQIENHTISGNQKAFQLIEDRIIRFMLRLYPDQASLFI